MKCMGCMITILIFFICAAGFPLTNYTVNHAGGADYTDLNACLSDINSGGDDTYIVTFTDTSAWTYTLSPYEQTIRDGVHLTFTADPGIVTVDGRLNVAYAGGTFMAENIHFGLVSGSQWCILHGYDGQYYTNCEFGPGTDNGVIVRSGINNSFGHCTFHDITNAAIEESGGTGSATNCTWTNCGYAVRGSSPTPGTMYPGQIEVNGGTVSINPSQYGFVLEGFRLILNGVEITGGWRAIHADWQKCDGELIADNCQFLQVRDQAVHLVMDTDFTSDYFTTITLNNCYIEQHPANNANGVTVESRGKGDKGVITLNACQIEMGSDAYGTGACCWKGGTINLNNTIIIGGDNSLLCTDEGGPDHPTLNVHHCDFLNAATQVLGGNGPNASITILNSIIDSSNVSGLNFGSAGTKVADHNMINAVSDYYGTNYITGDPQFVNRMAGDYHIQPSSPCANAGILTDLTVDMDGDPRPLGGANPDMGADEINEGLPPTPTPTPTTTPTPTATPTPTPTPTPTATPSGETILPNGDAELIYVDLLHWDYHTAGTTVYYNPAFAQSGDRCMKLDFRVGDNQEWTHAIFAVEPGATYLCRGYYRVPEAVSSGAISIIIRWFRDYERDWAEFISQENLATNIGTTVADYWVMFEKTVTAPADAVAADLTIWSGAQGPEGQVYFDNFTIVKTSGPDSATIYMMHEGWTHLGFGKYWSASTDLICSLAGMLAQLNCGEYIFLYGSPSYTDSSYRWGLGLTTFYSARLDFSFDHPNKYWDLINHLKHHLPNQEFIKFSYDVPYTCRWVMSLAGLEQCLAVEESLAADAQANCGFTERESIVTGWTESQLWNRYISHPDATRELMCENITEYPSDYRYYLGDLAVCEKAWFFWDPDRGEPRNTYLDWLDDDARHIGVSAGDEGQRISEISIRGVATIPADWSWNLATLSRFASKTPRTPLRANPLTMRDIQWEDDVCYCTFVLTDGDNLQYHEGYHFYFSDLYWGNSHRGEFGMGWQLPPSVTDYAPVIFAFTCDPLSPLVVSDKDCWVTGVSGDGVFFVGPPSDTAHTFGTATSSGSDLITTHAQRLNVWMKDHAINIITAFPYTRSEWLSYDFANYATALERPLGFIVDTYSGCYVDGYGELKWAQDKNGYYIPVKSVDYALWDASCGNTATEIAGFINSAPHSGSPVAASFKHVAAHAWSWMDPPDNGIINKIAECISLMNSYVRVVRPDEFLMQMRLRLQTTQELQRYHFHLSAKTSELDGLTPPTVEAADALNQAKQSLSQAQPLISSNPSQAFSLLQQADQQTEVARLSFLSLSDIGSQILIDCPTEAAPLYHFSLSETDWTALPVRVYRVQVDDNPDFLSPDVDIQITTNYYVPPFSDCYIRARAQGRSHGDWGYWSQTLHHQVAGIRNWYLY